MQVVETFLLAFLIGRGCAAFAPAPGQAPPDSLDPHLARILLTNDFESGSMSPWYDTSPGKVNWQPESLDAPSESNYPAPRPDKGAYYVRATRNADLQSGLAVLSSPVFTAQPGDLVTFSFWIRSRRPQANTLEVFTHCLFEKHNYHFIQFIIQWSSQLDFVRNGVESVLVDLTEYSSLSNTEWRTMSVAMPFNESVDISVTNSHFQFLQFRRLYSRVFCNWKTVDFLRILRRQCRRCHRSRRHFHRSRWFLNDFPADDNGSYDGI